MSATAIAGLQASRSDFKTVKLDPKPKSIAARIEDSTGALMIDGTNARTLNGRLNYEVDFSNNMLKDLEVFSLDSSNLKQSIDLGDLSRNNGILIDDDVSGNFLVEHGKHYKVGAVGTTKWGTVGDVSYSKWQTGYDISSWKLDLTTSNERFEFVDDISKVSFDV